MSLQKTILITGATGFVGRRLVQQLQLRGASLICATRITSAPQKPLENVKNIVVGECDANADWQFALKDIDYVIHCAARVHVMNEVAQNPLAEFRRINVEGTLHLARQAAAAGVKRFIFLSSVKVNGEATQLGHPYTENDMPNPQDDYGISKLEAELGLQAIAQQTGMEVVIIRPPLIYGAGVKANFLAMINLVKKRLPLPLGAIHNKRSFVYIDNIVSLMMLCLTHPSAANQIFLASDDHDLSTTDLLRECARAANVSLILLPIPVSWLRFAALCLGKQAIIQRLCGSLQVDVSKAKKMLNWQPDKTVQEGLKVTAQAIDN